jgi:hypothetical protein
MKVPSRARFVAINIVAPLALSWLLISRVQARYFDAAPRVWSRDVGSFGPLTLKLQLSGASGGTAEPILTMGRAGQATLVFIRMLSDRRAKVGIEFWGNGAVESPPFEIPPAGAQVTVEASFPALFPVRGSLDWGAVSDAEQRHLLSRYVVAVDHVARVSGPVNYEQPANSPIYLGANPLGGSIVCGIYSGKVLAAWHEY